MRTSMVMRSETRLRRKVITGCEVVWVCEEERDRETERGKKTRGDETSERAGQMALLVVGFCR